YLPGASCTFVKLSFVQIAGRPSWEGLREHYKEKSVSQATLVDEDSLSLLVQHVHSAQKLKPVQQTEQTVPQSVPEQTTAQHQAAKKSIDVTPISLALVEEVYIHDHVGPDAPRARQMDEELTMWAQTRAQTTAQETDKHKLTKRDEKPKAQT